MKRASNVGILLLGSYLVLIGLMGILGIRLGQLSIIVPLLALVAGVCLLLGK